MKIFVVMLFVAMSVMAGDCRFSFAMLAEDGDPVVLSTSVYERLLEAVGSKASPETLQKMVDAGDPFTVPDQAGTDLLAFQRRMKELKDILEKKGWNTPVVRTAMVTRLATLRGLRIEAKRKVDRILRPWEDFTWELNGTPKPGVAVTPKGEFAVVTTASMGQATPESENPELKVMALDSRETHRYPIRGLGAVRGEIALNAAGDRLHLFTPSSVVAVPFHDGVPQWERKNVFQTDAGPFQMPASAENPRYVFSTDKSAIRRFDLETGKIHEVKFPEELFGSRAEVERVGSVGNTDSVYVLAQTKRGNLGRIFTFDFDANGKAQPHRVAAQWDGVMECKNLVWDADGQLYTNQGGPFYKWSSADPKKYEKIGDVDQPFVSSEQLVTSPISPMHPGGAITLLRSDQTEKRWAYYFEFANRKPHVIPIGPDPTGAKFEAGGDILAIRHGSGAVSFINIAKRVAPK